MPTALSLFIYWNIVSENHFKLNIWDKKYYQFKYMYWNIVPENHNISMTWVKIHLFQHFQRIYVFVIFLWGILLNAPGRRVRNTFFLPFSLIIFYCLYFKYIQCIHRSYKKCKWTGLQFDKLHPFSKNQSSNQQFTDFGSHWQYMVNNLYRNT